jgi:hypothetical protein
MDTVDNILLEIEKVTAQSQKLVVQTHAESECLTRNKERCVITSDAATKRTRQALEELRRTMPVINDDNLLEKPVPSPDTTKVLNSILPLLQALDPQTASSMVQVARAIEQLHREIQTCEKENADLHNQQALTEDNAETELLNLERKLLVLSTSTGVTWKFKEEVPVAGLLSTPGLAEPCSFVLPTVSDNPCDAANELWDLLDDDP